MGGTRQKVGDMSQIQLSAGFFLGSSLDDLPQETAPEGASSQDMFSPKLYHASIPQTKCGTNTRNRIPLADPAQVYI